MVKKGQTRLPPAEPMNRPQNRIQNWRGYSAMVFLTLEIIPGCPLLKDVYSARSPLYPSSQHSHAVRT